MNYSINNSCRSVISEGIHDCFRTCFEMIDEFYYSRFLLYFGSGMRERSHSYVTE